MELQYYFIIPFSAFLTDVAALIFLITQKVSNRYRNPLLLVYICLALWNLGIVFLYSVEEPIQAKYVLFTTHQVIPIMFASFLILWMRIANINWRFLSYGSIAGAGLIILYLYYEIYTKSLDQAIFVRKFSFGYYPTLSNWSQVFDKFAAITVLIGMSLVIFNRKRIWQNRDLRAIAIFLFLFLLSATTNFLPVYGYDIYPVGNAFDAIFSAFLITKLYYNEPIHRKQVLHLRLVGMLASISFSLIIIWLLTEFVLKTPSPFAMLVVSIFCSAISMAIYNFYFMNKLNISKNKSESLHNQLQSVYQLTPQEASICCSYADGRTKEEILKLLNIKDQTIKVHMTSIYKKTIGENNKSNRREKLSRLIYFLSALE